MKIKDIVNRDIVNLTNCDQEPIHIPGSIQPHGFLFGIDKGSRKIEFCSENAEMFTGKSYSFLLGKTFDEAFGSQLHKTVSAHFNVENVLNKTPLKVHFGNAMVELRVHQNDGYYILEGEFFNPKDQLSNVYEQTVKFISYMKDTDTLKDLCNLVAKGTREVTGYDRVMVYRFDSDYNGEVFAEDCREDLEPFFGLHYPHTDIPVQARELYMRNVTRLIADIGYTPVPIYTFDDGSNKNLDLSLSILRSTSPIHVEYLQNMGVGATLTISLIHQNRLWGLIACHHYSPKYLSHEVRMAAQLQGQFITSQIEVRQSNEQFEITRKTNAALEKINALDLPPVMESFKIISANENLCKVANASGVSLVINGVVFKNGLTPSNASILELSNWLSVYTNDTNLRTNNIKSIVKEIPQVYNFVSGLIYHSLGNNNSIIWYRPETIQEVNWGGDPNKAIVKDENGLHPRNSFNLWKEFVRHKSSDWHQPEINAAANYAHSIQKQISMMNLSEGEEKYRLLNEVLQETNSELENINWISTHDLQEPLRKIQLIASKVIAQEKTTLPENVKFSLERLNASANRMQNLLKDILKYTRIKNNAEAFVKVDLNEIVREILADSGEIIVDARAVINFEKLPTIDGIPFLLTQLFSNLILNSLKYGADDRIPEIGIKYKADANDVSGKRHVNHIIEITDNGIGFEPQYAETIFKIFSRLQTDKNFDGSGVGLALCRKIMKTHNGTITAKSSLGQGTTMTLVFPE